jgi:hypothetical protein
VRAVLAQTASIAIVVFAVSSMMSVGLAYRVGQLVGPLREARAVFRATVANFVLVPLLAVGIERLIPMSPPLARSFREHYVFQFDLAGIAACLALSCLASFTWLRADDGDGLCMAVELGFEALLEVDCLAHWS